MQTGREPVVQVWREPDGEVVYTLPINGESFTLLVREAGACTVLAFDPDGGYRQAWKGSQARNR